MLRRSCGDTKSIWNPENDEEKKKNTRRRETGDLIGASCLTPSAWTLENDFMFINKLSKKKKIFQLVATPRSVMINHNLQHDAMHDAIAYIYGHIDKIE